VKLLEADQAAAPEAATQAPPEQPPPSAPEGGTLCKSCGAPMEPEQDWCLNCGTAAPGRLGERPGWRAATTVIGLTLALVLGAVGAGYTALTHDDSKQATTAPPAAQAAIPPAVTPPPAATTTPPPAASAETPPPPPTSTTTPKSSLPKVTPPATSSTPTTPVIPVTPTPTTSTPSTSTPSTPPTSTPSTSTPSTSTPSTSTPSTSTPTTTIPAPAPIKLGDDAAEAYDPYTQAAASGEPAKALDGDGSTSWYVDPKNPASPNTGFLVDLGSLRGIREVQIATPTPGFRIEIYANDEATPPPSITDTRWSHIKDVSKVGSEDDGTQKLVLGAGTSKYRNLLLWFTGPPTEGSRIRLTGLDLLG
jgi:hypothetical protein